MSSPIIVDPMYQSIIINPDCDATGLYHAISKRLSEIEALALVASSDTFGTWCVEIRANYLNVIESHASETWALVKAHEKRLVCESQQK